MKNKILLWFSFPENATGDTIKMSNSNITHIIFDGNDVTEYALPSFPAFEFDLDTVHFCNRDEWCLELDAIGEIALFGKRVKIPMIDPYLITTDTLTTIDRYPSSPTRGEKVLEFVALWDEPGANKYDAKNLTGALSPGTEVTILEYCVVDYVLWVRCEAEQGGRNQAGWCNVMFLEKVGALYLETMVNV